MKLTIKTLDQKNYQVQTAGIKTVWDLKRKLFNSGTTNLMPERQQLMYAGRVLKDKKLLSKYSIDERKFLLVMSRKPSKATTTSAVDIKNNNTTNNGNTGNNKKINRLADAAKPHKANIGQGDGPDIGCATKRKQPTDINKRSKNHKNVKGTKTTTTLTGSKTVKMNLNKDELPAHAPRKKVKIMRQHKSTTSSASSTQDENMTKKHFCTSRSSINSSELELRRRPKSILRNVRRAKRMRGCLNHGQQQHTKVAEKGQCDELVLQQIVALGYSEEDVRRALNASFNDPNDAVNQLIQDVRERIKQQTFRKQNKQPSQQRKAAQSQKHCRILAKVKPKKSNALCFLRHDPDFQNLRRVVRDRPNILQNVLNRIGAVHPELLGLLKEHEDDFLQLLHERSEDTDEDHDSSCRGNEPVNMTPEEEKIIARLVRMGFKRQMVILAYFACDRNVEKAVDYLCRIGDIQI